MIDAQLRDLLRRAEQAGPAEKAAFAAAWLRAGGRDPRLDPAAGDVVSDDPTRKLRKRVWRVTGLETTEDPPASGVVVCRDKVGRLADRVRALMTAEERARPRWPITLDKWRRWAKDAIVLEIGEPR